MYSACVNTVCMWAHTAVYTVGAEGCRALSCLPCCVWFICCGGGITPGISRILAAPIDGTEMTVPIMESPASTPRYSPDLKWHKQQITRVRQQGKKSHITQWRLGWTNSSSAAWGYSTQTWRAVSHGPVWAGLGSCRQHVSAREFENKHHWYAFNNRQVCSCKHHHLQSRTLQRLSSRFHTNAHPLLVCVCEVANTDTAHNQNRWDGLA